VCVCVCTGVFVEKKKKNGEKKERKKRGNKKEEEEKGEKIREKKKKEKEKKGKNREKKREQKKRSEKKKKKKDKKKHREKKAEKKKKKRESTSAGFEPSSLTVNFLCFTILGKMLKNRNSIKWFKIFFTTVIPTLRPTFCTNFFGVFFSELFYFGFEAKKTLIFRKKCVLTCKIVFF